MKIPLSFVELHNPVFVAGKNFKDKIQCSAEVSLEYDRTEKELHLFYKGVVAILPSTSINAMIPIDSSPFMKDHKPAEVPKRPRTHIVHASKLDISKAQISDPTSIVQNPRTELQK